MTKETFTDRAVRPDHGVHFRVSKAAVRSIIAGVDAIDATVLQAKLWPLDIYFPANLGAFPVRDVRNFHAHLAHESRQPMPERYH